MPRGPTFLLNTNFDFNWNGVASTAHAQYYIEDSEKKLQPIIAMILLGKMLASVKENPMTTPTAMNGPNAMCWS